MTVGAAWRDGVRRVNAAPFVLIGMFAVTLLIALPLAIALRGMIEAHLGDSLTAAAVADGNDLDWWHEFSSQASGLGTTFVPSIVGFSAVLDNIGGLLDNLPMAATVAGATAAWMMRLVVPERRRSRSLRAPAADAVARFLCRLRHALLAFPAPRRAGLALLRAALLADPPVAVRRSVSVDDARPDRRAHRLSDSPGVVSRVRRLADRVQSRIRLRPDPHRRRGPPQRHRIAGRGRTIRASSSSGCTVVRAERSRLPGARGRLRAH